MGKTASVELFATADVARRLGITPNGVRVARKRGDIQPTCTTPGGVALYDDPEVNRFAKLREARRKVLEEAQER